MGEKTGIAWTTSSWSPWIGCTKVSPGCDGCYAEALDARHKYGGDTHWGIGRPRHRTKAWNVPLAWNRKAEASGKRWTVFPSLCDPFDNEVPAAWFSEFVGLIRATRALTWLLLTKRIGNVARMMPETANFKHVWIGASVVNQEEAVRDIPKLGMLPAAKRFISYEPALGQVDWSLVPLAGIHWLIVGGESSQGKHRARPFNVVWARATLAQCKAAGVPVFVKQLGSHPQYSIEGRAAHDIWLKDRAGAEPAEWPEDLRVQEYPA